MLLSIRRSNDCRTNKHIAVIILEKPLIAFTRSAICGERTVNCGPSAGGKDEGRDESQSEPAISGPAFVCHKHWECPGHKHLS